MEIEIKGLKKYFTSGNELVKALDDINLTIPKNTIFTLLGPSGCGKTTLLRCIVGLETPDEGEIKIGDEIVWSSEKNIFLPTEKRNLGMVFQTYAIWPHMNVFDNVAYPLQVRKIPKEEIKERVAKTLSFVQLKGYENRPATKLSGGQQQRVALARALVAEPKVILFDEPLSNLDAKLREETRKDLKVFLSELEITAIYVTHDRVEALALSDDIAVMRTGKVIERGTPKKIYFEAEDRFVADFIGRSNLVPSVVKEQNENETVVASSLGQLSCKKADFPVGTEVTLCLRPEFIKPRPEKSSLEGSNIVEGVVDSLVFVGDAYEGEIKAGDMLLLARISSQSSLKDGDKVYFNLEPEHCLLVPAK